MAASLLMSNYAQRGALRLRPCYFASSRGHVLSMPIRSRTIPRPGPSARLRQCPSAYIHPVPIAPGYVPGAFPLHAAHISPIANNLTTVLIASN